MDVDEDYDCKDGILAAKLGSKECAFTKLGKKLFQMAKEGDAEEVKRLIAKGAPFHTNLLGTSPLHWAAHYNHIEVTEVLLKAGISVNAKNKVDRAPIHEAAHMGNPSVLKLLLAYGADVDSLDMLQMTPLHWAGESGNTACVQLLLDYGCDLNCVSKFQKTALEVAQGNHYYAAVQMIKNAMKEDPAMRKIKVKHFKEGHKIIAVKENKESSELSSDLSSNKRKRFSTVIVSKPNPVTGVQTTLELINDMSDDEKEFKIRKIKLKPSNKRPPTKSETQLKDSEKSISNSPKIIDKPGNLGKVEPIKDHSKMVFVPKNPLESQIKLMNMLPKRGTTRTTHCEYALQKLKNVPTSKFLIKTDENKTPKLVTIPKLVSINKEDKSLYTEETIKSKLVKINASPSDKDPKKFLINPLKSNPSKSGESSGKFIKIVPTQPKQIKINPLKSSLDDTDSQNEPNQIKITPTKLSPKNIIDSQNQPNQLKMIPLKSPPNDIDCQIGNVLITKSPDKIKQKLIRINNITATNQKVANGPNPAVNKITRIDANQLINMKKKKVLFFRKPVAKNNATNTIREMIEEKLKTAQNEAEDLREKLRQKEEEINGYKSFIENMKKS